MLLRRIMLIGTLSLTFLTGRTQVNVQTGSAIFSLPMFNWQDDKSRLNAVVALNYNSGNGLRVNDVASNVGQGWNLIAGGSITRMQVGEPDDQPAFAGVGNHTDQDITKYPAGFLYAQTPTAQGCPLALTKYPIYGSMNTLYTQHNSTAEDKQLDYFSFQFNGKSGMFILDGQDGDIGVPLGDTKLKIAFQRDPTMTSQGIRTTITSFTITDVDGFIYRFAKHGLTKILKSSFSDANGTAPQTQPKIGNGGIYHQAGFDLGPTAYPWTNSQLAYPFTIGSWYLTEVDDPLTGRKILYNYAYTRNINSTAGADIIYNNSLDKYIIISHKTSITQTPALSSIVYPDGHTVTLNYSPVNRFDLVGDIPLASVDITYLDRGQTRYLSEYQLNTTYFIKNRYGTPNSPYQTSMARLCLKSVRKIGPDLKEDNPPYIFDYYMGSSNADDYVPPPFFYAKDVWGYYNGSNSVDFYSSAINLNNTLNQLTFYQLEGLCFLNNSLPGQVYLNPKANYAQNGLLKQIVYPTGGSLTYTYAQNNGTMIGASSPTNVGGVHVATTSVADGGFSNGCANPVITSYNYVMNGPGSASSLWGLEKPLNSIVSNNYYAWEKSTLHVSISCGICCKWHFTYPGILSQNESVSLSDFQKFMTAIAPVLGVLSIISDVLDVVNVCLDATPLAIVAVALDLIASVVTLILSCQRYTKYTPDTMYYNFDMNGSAPLPAQFKRVEIVENPGTIGKTVQEFTSSDDYPLWQPLNPVLSAKQRFAPWAYGLPKLITTYDASGNMITQTKSVYDTNYARTIIYMGSGASHQLPPPALCTKCQVLQNSSQRNDDWSNATVYNDPSQYTTSSVSSVMNVDFYNLYTGRMELDSVFERNYKIGTPSQYVEKVTKYTYSPWNYEVNSVTVSESNGDKRSKYISYSSDVGGNYVDVLSNNNILNVPVTISTNIVPKSSIIFDFPIDDFNYYYQVYGDNTSFVTNEKTTHFTQLPNGDIRASDVLEHRFSQPYPSKLYFDFGGSADANGKVIQSFTYDANSNLTGIKDEGGRSVTNIYDYNDKYIVASAVNVDAATEKIAYTSFEGTDLSRSGWAYTGSNAAFNANTASPTGTGSLNLLASGANSLTAAGLNTSQPYLLSFWASGGGISVSAGSTLVKSAPAYNGFTYYEYTVAQGTTAITLSNATASAITIDELRLYPSKGRMRSTTYDPMIGKTSECDENNHITYFTYDNMGRMQFVKDEGRNIIKTYEYNTVSAAKQNGCPAAFTNNLISEVFYRTNCGAGYLGGPYTYSVTAARYSSTISQQDADIQAEIDLLTNGPAAANTSGSCSLIYYNTAQSITDTTQSCAEGYNGGLVTYTVPANRYSSIVSQADANQQAMNEALANAQAYANDPANAVCTVSTAPDWDWSQGDPSYCLTVNGTLPAHLFVQLTDINPNSPSYGQKQWQDAGPNDMCPANYYYNAQQSGSFNRNNCTGGGGQTIVYTVAAGTYSSTVSQAAANQLAINDVNANGQAYANAHGNCCQPTLNFTAGITNIIMNSMSLSSTTVNFVWVFQWPSTSVTSLQIGTIGGMCTWPTSTRTVLMYQGTTAYSISISSSGIVTVTILSGPVPSSVVGFSGTYDLNQNAFYSAAASGTYTKNNCPAGQVGSSVTYSVQPYAYKSFISQADANTQATNAVSANGQNYANTNGTCSTPCTFTWNSGITNHLGSSLSVTGSTVTFNFTFLGPTSNWYGGTLGTITGGCLPSSNRFVTVTDQATPSRAWTLTITTTGVVSVNLNSGSPANTSYPPVVLNGSFSL